MPAGSLRQTLASRAASHYSAGLKVAPLRPPDMSLSTDLALTGLQQAAAQADNAKLDGRLAGVGRLLGDDLAWLERNIQELARSGLPSASDAARHLIALGGKRVRPMTLLLSAA